MTDFPDSERPETLTIDNLASFPRARSVAQQSVDAASVQVEPDPDNRL